MRDEFLRRERDAARLATRVWRLEGALASSSGDGGVGATAGTGAADGNSNAATPATPARVKLETRLLVTTAEVAAATAASAKATDGLTAATAKAADLPRHLCARDCAAAKLKILVLVLHAEFVEVTAAAADAGRRSILLASSE